VLTTNQKQKYQQRKQMTKHTHRNHDTGEDGAIVDCHANKFA
jgi:hypothetical protein